LKKFTDREDKAIVGFSSDAEKLVLNYAWPGNVRQLENSIHSAVVMSSGPLITDQCIANALRIKLDNPELKAPAVQSLSSTNALSNAAATTVTNTTETFTNNVTLLERKQAHEPGVNPINEAILPLAHLEQLAIKKAIDQCEGNVVRAAGLLQVSPSTLYRKIQSWESA
jgi:two-component system repressor protein LuxO